MEIERVKIKRFFIWKFTLTSFAFGVFLGVILSLILLMASALDLGKTNLFGKPVDLLQMNLVQSYSIIGIIVLSLLFAFLGFLFACFYNTFSRIGFNLDLGLVPVEQKQKEIKEQPTTEITPTIEPAPVSNQTPQPTTPNNFY